MGHEISEQDLMVFQAEKGIDDRSFAGLKELETTDQIVVMDVVRKQDCKNPSAVTWSMVRAIKANPASMRLQYIQKHLDERCAEALSRLPTETQAHLATRIDFARCRNISALVWSQIKGISPPPSARGLAPGHGHYGGAVPMRAAGAIVPSMPQAHFGASAGGLQPVAGDFAARSGLDSKVTASLAELGPEEQHLVVQLVEKQACRNPSAVCWAMIKYVRQDPAEAKRQRVLEVLDPEAAAEFGGLDPQAQAALLGQLDLSRCRNVSAFVVSRAKMPMLGGGELGWAQTSAASFRDRSRSPRGGEDGDLHAFAALHALDPKAVEALGTLGPDDREVAMRLFELKGARNPSAVCWSMVKIVREDPAGARARLEGAGVPPRRQAQLAGETGDLDALLGASAGELGGLPGEELPNPELVAGVTLDSRCLQALRELPPAVQLDILQSVDVNACRNPSAFVFSKIRLLGGQR